MLRKGKVIIVSLLSESVMVEVRQGSSYEVLLGAARLKKVGLDGNLYR